MHRMHKYMHNVENKHCQHKSSKFCLLQLLEIKFCSLPGEWEKLVSFWVGDRKTGLPYPGRAHELGWVDLDCSCYCTLPLAPPCSADVSVLTPNRCKKPQRNIFVLILLKECRKHSFRIWKILLCAQLPNMRGFLRRFLIKFHIKLALSGVYLLLHI